MKNIRGDRGVEARWLVRRWLLVLLTILTIGLLQPSHASAEAYHIVALSGWYEGVQSWDCTTDNCAYSSYTPGGAVVWQGGPLPLGHYFWHGGVEVFYCINGLWAGAHGVIGFFNYDPRTGDQSIKNGVACSVSGDPAPPSNPNTGDPECSASPVNEGGAM